MGRLTSVAPRIGTVRARLGTAGGGRAAIDKQRGLRPWRKWYGTARWRVLRMTVLARDLFTCQWPGCGRIEADTSKLVADHRRPHRGDARLFWDEGNLWTLCATCHSSKKQRAEQAAAARGEDIDD